MHCVPCADAASRDPYAGVAPHHGVPGPITRMVTDQSLATAV